MMATTSRNLPGEVPSVTREPSQNEALRSNKSKENMSSSSLQESPLKRAIKENENSIIQSILSPSPSLNGSSAKDKSASSDENSYSKVGLSPLLDYLFEDGQLTRIEYDFVDKGFGGTEQIQMLLKILVEAKDEEALVTLLDYLYKQDPNSDTIRRLSQNFLFEQEMRMRGEIFHGHANNTSTVIGVKGLREVIEATKTLSLQNTSQKDDSNVNKIISAKFRRNIFASAENSSRSTQRDFYYGKNQRRSFPSDSEESDKIGHEGKENERILTGGSGSGSSRAAVDMSKQQQLSKRNSTGKKSVTMDVRDFYMTSGCLETARNLILHSDRQKSCRESLTAAAWERVLRNMNGLLSTDVLSIKELLFHHQLQLHSPKDCIQANTRDDVERDICKEDGEDEKGINNIELEGDEKSLGNAMIMKNKTSLKVVEERRRASNDPPATQETQEEDIEFHEKEALNWEQILYHSFQIWKLRNGRNSTFYSLVGVFQHSALFQTADFLLVNKMEIQSRENEKESADVFTTALSSPDKVALKSGGTMLEKSDFLRKFYNSTPSSGSGSLTTMNDRLCVSPILSLDLLL